MTSSWFKSVYAPHDEDDITCCAKPVRTTVVVCAIDPGVFNCAIRIAQKKEGVIGVETIFMGKFDFSKIEHCQEKKSNVVVNKKKAPFGIVLKNAAHVLRAMEPYLIMCDYIMVEAQLAVNTAANRLAHHIISVCGEIVLNKGVRPILVEIDPRAKSQVLGAPAHLDKPALKRWASLKGVSLLREHGEEDIAVLVESIQKRDDLGDVICYTEAFFRIQGGVLAR
jgi:hypothetical protein